MLSQQCDLIEHLDATNQSNPMHAQIRKNIGAHKGNATTTCIEDKDGNIIMDQDFCVCIIIFTIRCISFFHGCCIFCNIKCNIDWVIINMIVIILVLCFKGIFSRYWMDLRFYYCRVNLTRRVCLLNSDHLWCL